MQDSEYSCGDVTLIALLRAVEDNVSEKAAEEFYHRYVDKLMSLVQRNLAGRFSARVQPEDIVQSIFASWFKNAKDGQIRPNSQKEVWKLLSVVALCHVRNKVKFHDAQKRAVARSTADSSILSALRDPTEAEVFEFMDVIQVASKRLDDKVRQTLEMTLEGKSTVEIAEALGRTTKSVSRYRAIYQTVLLSLLDDDLRQIGEQQLEQGDLPID